MTVCHHWRILTNKWDQSPHNWTTYPKSCDSCARIRTYPQSPIVMITVADDDSRDWSAMPKNIPPDQSEAGTSVNWFQQVDTPTASWRPDSIATDWISRGYANLPDQEVTNMPKTKCAGGPSVKSTCLVPIHASVHSTLVPLSSSVCYLRH